MKIMIELDEKGQSTVGTGGTGSGDQLDMASGDDGGAGPGSEFGSFSELLGSDEGADGGGPPQSLLDEIAAAEAAQASDPAAGTSDEVDGGSGPSGD